MNENKCGCCNTCNAYGYKELWSKIPPCEKNVVESNIKNGCWLCNNQYYNLNNKEIYNYVMNNNNIDVPYNIGCKIDVNSFLRIGNRS